MSPPTRTEISEESLFVLLLQWGFGVFIFAKNLQRLTAILICGFFGTPNMTSRGCQDLTAYLVGGKKIKADVTRRLGRLVTAEQRGRLILSATGRRGGTTQCLTPASSATRVATHSSDRKQS